MRVRTMAHKIAPGHLALDSLQYQMFANNNSHWPIIRLWRILLPGQGIPTSFETLNEDDTSAKLDKLGFWCCRYLFRFGKSIFSEGISVHVTILAVG